MAKSTSDSILGVIQ